MLRKLLVVVGFVFSLAIIPQTTASQAISNSSWTDDSGCSNHVVAFEESYSITWSCGSGGGFESGLTNLYNPCGI